MGVGIMDAVAAAQAVGPVVRAGAAEGESARRLAPQVVAALAGGGLLRMAVPAAYGGPEVPPLEQLAAIEEVAHADGAAGWCVAISTTSSSLSWFMAPEHAASVFADPLAAYGGAFAPTGTGTSVEGGWRCDGRWAWGSGTTHCAWITGGCTTDTGEFHLMFFGADQVAIHDNWDPVGLRGSGSNDYEVAGAFVPAGRSVRPGVDRHAVDADLARFPNFTFLASSVAAVALGIARRASDELVALAATKTPALTRSTLAEHPPAQLAVAAADATTRAARALLHDEVGRAWDQVLAGERVPVDQRARIRLACAYAADAAAEAVDRCQRVAGGSAVPVSSPLARCFRDVHTATQHLMLADRNHLTYGRLRFGLDVETSTL